MSPLANERTLNQVKSSVTIPTQESAALESNRRRSTGGILKRIKHWDEEEGLPSRKENEPPKSKMPDPKFHEKQELYNRRGKQSEMVGILFKKTGEIKAWLEY